MGLVGGEYLFYLVLLAAINHAPAGTQEIEIRVADKPLMKLVKEGAAWVEPREQSRTSATFDTLTLTQKAGGQRKIDLGKEIGIQKAADWKALKEAKFRDFSVRFESTKDGWSIAAMKEGKTLNYAIAYKLADGNK